MALPVRPVPAPSVKQDETARDDDSPATAQAEDDNPFVLLQEFLERVRLLVKAGDPLPWPELEAIVNLVVRETVGSPELFWVAHAATPPVGIDAVAFHQARVAVLAVRVGANLGLERSQLVELGLAASLIDVGFWLVGGGRRDPQSPEYRNHPRLSADLVRRWSPPSEVIVQAVVQHHELEHGQGFPQGLQRDAIHVYARILGLVDRYATLTAAAPGRAPASAHEVIRDIVRSKNDEFSPALIKALLSEISIFPPGTTVRLNTGELGRVIGVNRHHPLRPRVELVADGKGHPLPAPRVVDLSETPFLYITGPATETR